MLLNIVAASVIAWYQDTLASVIALAVFLPIISDMSGCSGNQAVAVSIRELSLVWYTHANGCASGAKRWPSAASGPILTTITDMCGFFFVLSFATALLAHLAS
jgi:Mg/Co/Ni transporter MgtE